MKREWTNEEAKLLGDRIGIDWQKVSLEEFRKGLKVELEHGSVDPQTDVTSDDPILTARIALAHLKELPDYYSRLELMELNEGSLSKMEKAPLHYYGDLVRRLFMVAGFLMILSLPLWSNLIHLPSFMAIVGVLAMVVVAGLTSPINKGVMILNAVISLIGFAIFESQAVFSFADLGMKSSYVWFNQIISIIFFLSLYFSLKTIRSIGSK